MALTHSHPEHWSAARSNFRQRFASCQEPGISSADTSKGGLMGRSRLLAAAAFAVVAGVGSQAWAAGESCNRACLESFVDKYLDAVVADQPSMVPLSPSVRFTEDGVQLVI